MLAKSFQPCRLPPQAEALRHEIRAFLDTALADYPRADRAYSWMGFDATFTRQLAARGWIGMTWPKRYGGGEHSAFARYVLVEELLATGAPVLAHWTADRQSGPLLLNYGTESQKMRFLPPICWVLTRRESPRYATQKLSNYARQIIPTLSPAATSRGAAPRDPRLSGHRAGRLSPS